METELGIDFGHRMARQTWYSLPYRHITNSTAITRGMMRKTDNNVNMLVSEYCEE